MAPSLSIVMTYRDRDLPRIQRCMESLQRQTFREFEVIFVDYGSQASFAQSAKGLMEKYPFCRYIYADTRGWFWNRSHALNIGIRFAAAPFIMTTDIDILFPPTFLQTCLQTVDETQVLYCAPYFTNQEFSEWENIDAYRQKFMLGNQNQLGGFQLVHGEALKKLGAYDEYYCFWGREDTDMRHRLLASGLKETWMNDKTYIYHQWHPIRNYWTEGFMPDDLPGRVMQHYFRLKKQLVRNGPDWGRMVETKDRPVFRYLDPEKKTLLVSEGMLTFSGEPYQPHSVVALARLIGEAPSGAVLKVEHTLYPRTTRWFDLTVKAFNRLSSVLQPALRLGYRPNLVNNFLVGWIQEHPEEIRDYYQHLPQGDGSSLVILA